MTKKKTVYEELCKLGPETMAEVMTNVFIDFVRSNIELDIDREYLAEKLHRYLKAPAADYYLCSVQEANVLGED